MLYMAKRVIDEPCNIPLYIRVSESMKKAVDSAADECQMSTSEWLRRAVEHELERESDGDVSQVIKNMDDLQAYVEKAVAKAIENKLKSD